MNDLKYAAKLALEALKDCRRDPRLKYEHKFHDKVIKALEESLAKQEQGEPVKDVEISNMGKPFTVKTYVTPLVKPAALQGSQS